MSKTTPTTIYTGHAQKRPQEDTTFGLWLKARGISKNKAATLIGCSPKMVDLWTSGRVIPDLLYALKIEQITEGGVGMEMWVGTALGRHRWAEIEKRAKPQ